MHIESIIFPDTSGSIDGDPGVRPRISDHVQALITTIDDIATTRDRDCPRCVISSRNAGDDGVSRGLNNDGACHSSKRSTVRHDQLLGIHANVTNYGLYRRACAHCQRTASDEVDVSSCFNRTGDGHINGGRQSDDIARSNGINIETMPERSVQVDALPCDCFDGSGKIDTHIEGVCG